MRDCEGRSPVAISPICHCEERSDEAISPICHCEESRCNRDDVAISPVRPQPERLLRPSAEGLATTREDCCLLPHDCCLATSHESRCNRGDVAIPAWAGTYAMRRLLHPDKSGFAMTREDCCLMAVALQRATSPERRATKCEGREALNDKKAC